MKKSGINLKEKFPLKKNLFEHIFFECQEDRQMQLVQHNRRLSIVQKAC